MSGIGEYEYQYAQEVITADPPFYGVLAILIMQADTRNLVKLMSTFPDEVAYVRRMRNGGRDSGHNSYPSISGPDIVPDRSGNSDGKMVPPQITVEEVYRPPMGTMIGSPPHSPHVVETAGGSFWCTAPECDYRETPQ